MQPCGKPPATRPATRRQPPRGIWIAHLCVGLASIPIAALGFWQFSSSDEIFHLVFGVCFALMAVTFLINAALLRRRSRNNAGPWQPGTGWGEDGTADPAPWN